MNILNTTNLKDYWLILIALNGQLHEEVIKDITMGEAYKQRTLWELIRESKIDKTITELGTVYRIKRPNGLNAILEISQELYDHYLLITNNHKKRNDTPYLSRVITQSKVSTILLQNNYSIDTLIIQYDNTKRTIKKPSTIKLNDPAPQPNGFTELTNNNHLAIKESPPQPNKLLDNKIKRDPLIKRGGPLQPIVTKFNSDYIRKFINKEDSIYLTSIIFKTVIPKLEELSLIVSRFTGIILSPGVCYTVYQLDHDQSWIVDTEKKFQKALEHYLKDIYSLQQIKKYNFANKRGTGIFFIENYKINIYMSIGNRKKYKSITPVVPYHVCDDCHLLPLDKEKSKAPLTILKTVDWETKLKQIIYTEEELSNANMNPEIKADAFIRGRGYSWEMLSCNLKKLYIIEEGEWIEPVNILCYKWQHKALVETLKRVKVSYTIINDAELIKRIGGHVND